MLFKFPMSEKIPSMLRKVWEFIKSDKQLSDEIKKCGYAIY